MGGNAIKKFGPSKRLPSSEYDELALDILATLSRENVTPRLIQSYHTKPDHGDMDILVPGAFHYYNSPADVMTLLNAVGSVKNGSVTSYAIPYHDELFQLDLITVPEKHIEFAERYFSYNDLGNLLGRVAHRMGFKLGHLGLNYVLRDNTLTTHVIGEATITNSWDEAIEFLGYSAERYSNGFETPIDIFEYTLSSPFASREIYLLENRNSISRIRDRKRKTYTDFLAWLDNTSIPHSLKETTKEEKRDFKSANILRAMEAFPQFKLEIESLLDKYAESILLKDRFNGKIVGDLTGLAHAELGHFMSYFKREYTAKDLINLTTEQVAVLIRYEFHGYDNG